MGRIETLCHVWDDLVEILGLASGAETLLHFSYSALTQKRSTTETKFCARVAKGIVAIAMIPYLCIVVLF